MRQIFEITIHEIEDLGYTVTINDWRGRRIRDMYMEVPQSSNHHNTTGFRTIEQLAEFIQTTILTPVVNDDEPQQEGNADDISSLRHATAGRVQPRPLSNG